MQRISRRTLVSLGAVALTGLAACEDDEPSGTASSVNVKDFGARGDDKTDDTAAFAQAMAVVAEGGVVRVPTGRYRLSETERSGAAVLLKDGVTLRGPGTLAYVPGSAYSLKLVGVRGRGATVEGITFDLRDAPQGQPFAVSVGRSASDVTLADLTIEDNPVRGGIQLLGGEGIAISHCRISGMAQNGITLYGDGPGEGPQNVTISHCTIDAQVQPIDSEPVNGALARAVTISDCDLTSSGANYAVALSGTQGARLRNCKLGGALYLSGAVDCTVEHNTINATRSRFPAAVMASRSARNVTLRDNTVLSANGQTAIQIARGGHYTPQDVTVARNVLRVVNGTGLSVGDAERVQIRGNRIVGSGVSTGLAIRAQLHDTTLIVTGNIIRDCDPAIQASGIRRSVALELGANRTPDGPIVVGDVHIDGSRVRVVGAGL